jgi:hypothetical protein
VLLAVTALPGPAAGEEAQKTGEAQKPAPQQSKVTVTSSASSSSLGIPGKTVTEITIDDDGIRIGGERVDTEGTEIKIDGGEITINGRRIDIDDATSITIDRDGIKIGGVRIDTDQGVVREYDSGEYYDEDGTRISISGKDVVRFGDDVIIDEGEVVGGDAVAILGSVLVNGTLEGDAVAVGGTVTVGPHGRVDGDAVGIGGGVSKDPGGVIRGERVSIGRGGHWAGTWDRGGFTRYHRPFPWGFFSRGGRLLMWIVWTIMLVLLALLITAVARRPVETISMKAKHEAFKMGLIGLAAWLLLGPAMLLFIVTIIGIPIGLLVLPMVFALALLVGYTAVSLAVGERFGGGANGRSPYVSVAIGILVLQALNIIAGIIRMPGSWIGAFGFVIALIGYAVIFVAATVGLGAVITTRFGTAKPKPAPAAPGAILPPVGTQAPPIP